MTEIQAIRRAALEFRRLAEATELPTYAAMMLWAAEDLERRLSELTIEP